MSIVTGGALRIGGATSRRLATRGDLVVLNDLDEQAARRTGDEIVATGGGARSSVNNEGDFRPAARDFPHSRPEQWTRPHQINLLHVFALTNRVLPAVIAQLAGAIVNNSTVEAFGGIPGHAVYAAPKAWVSPFIKSLAVDVGRAVARIAARPQGARSAGAGSILWILVHPVQPRLSRSSSMRVAAGTEVRKTSSSSAASSSGMVSSFQSDSGSSSN